MAAPVVIIGATGKVGGATLAALREAGVEAVAFVRDRDRAAEHLGPDQPVRVGDLTDKRSVAAALQGIERVHLCSGHDPGLVEQQLNAVKAIADSDVRRIVKISSSPVATRPDSPARVGRDHAAIEEALRATGRETVAIRPNVFMQSLLGQAAAVASGILPGPEGDLRVSFVDVADIGRVAATALMADEPPADVLEVTGPEALTWPDVAAAMSAVLGRRITFHATPPDVMAEGMRALGHPQWLIEHMLELGALLSEAKAAEVTDTVERLTGRSPKPLREFLTEYAAAFARAA
jgi:uncharacterized protein YbjT (DUF2867 family)